MLSKLQKKIQRNVFISIICLKITFKILNYSNSSINYIIYSLNIQIFAKNIFVYITSGTCKKNFLIYKFLSYLLCRKVYYNKLLCKCYIFRVLFLTITGDIKTILKIFLNLIEEKYN